MDVVRFLAVVLVWSSLSEGESPHCIQVEEAG